MNQRVLFQSKTGHALHLKTTDGDRIDLVCTDEQSGQWDEILHWIRPGSVLNLIHTVALEESRFSCELIILEPDYLLDISSLAECYRPFGHHPLNYTLSRLRLPENTRHILLGNTANYFMDALVHDNEERPADYRQLLRDLFKTAPFEFTACRDLQDVETERHFFDACRMQYAHIRKVVGEQFYPSGLDKEKVVLEPSFISNVLGLQGRLDVMLQDFSALVELKSGKAEEDFRTGAFMHSSIHHYTQMILYLAVLECNLQLSHEQVRSYLLYSKYPVLSPEKHSRKHLREVLHLRNCMVAIEDAVRRENNSAYTGSVLESITSSTLNTQKMRGKFYENYLLPQIDACRQLMDALSDLERMYFLRMYTFIVKEMWTAKLGEREYEGFKRASNLWSAPVEEKIAAGELLYDLRILHNQASQEKHCIEFEVPVYPDNYLPNFRPGDAVVLYESRKSSGKQYTINETQVFKGAVEMLVSGRIRIRLRARQRNTSVLPEDSLYAVEHDHMDAVFTGMFRGLTAFAQANQDRKDLLLGLRLPEFRSPDDCSFSAGHSPDSISGIVGKALAAKDCFLLIGPPGTGKTSLALKEMVVSFLKENRENPQNILLLSYTNRAVDEICKALLDIDEHLPFMRVGSELNGDPAFHSRLLDRLFESCNSRNEVRSLIDRIPVVVGTVASVWNKPDLFQLKHFDLAIVDEATQLLEPHLLGIFSVKDKAGRNAVERFVLIGDHKQLPAVILQTKEESEVREPALRAIGITNISDSLFERLYRIYSERGADKAFDMLRRQGRMHPEIARFPSDYFYEGRLEVAGLPHQEEKAPHLFPFPHRLLFFPSSRSPEDTTDKVNHREARLAATVARELYDHYRLNNIPFDRDVLGIITPYRSQIALIRNEIQWQGNDLLDRISIDTVERFQGSQKDVIFYSFCVNADWQLHSLPNILEENGKIIDRKLNVVLTRARKQLIIAGNPDFLTKNPLYAALIHHLSRAYNT